MNCGLFKEGGASWPRGSFTASVLCVWSLGRDHFLWLARGTAPCMHVACVPGRDFWPGAPRAWGFPNVGGIVAQRREGMHPAGFRFRLYLLVTM